ncbi:hypothetical protein O6115_14375, partial [Salmonella enterica subsp. enterica]|uniref:CARDB domain-containing protein n=1 Tax=Salmonella enterica TaxID=28901 RepID=UPI0015C51A0C
MIDAFSSSGAGPRSIALSGTAIEPDPPVRELSLRLKSAGKVKRGKTLVVKATVKNTGNGTVKSIRLKTSVPGKLAKAPKATKVTSLAEGKSITKKIKVKIKRSARK